MAVYDLTIVDTSHNSNGLFSTEQPIAQDNPNAYIELIRKKYADFKYRQLFACQLIVYNRNPDSIRYTGPFAKEAKHILENLTSSSQGETDDNVNKNRLS